MRRSGSLSLVVIVVIAVGWLTYTLTFGGRSPQLGLDLQGGTSVVLAPREKANSAQLDQSISIIRRRVDGLGVAEPEITRQGDFIVVSLPGVKDRDRAIQVVGQTAKLQFRPTCGELPTGLPDAQYEAALSPSGQFAGCVAPNGAAPPAGGEPATSTPAGESSVPADPGAPAPSSSQTGLGLPPHGHLSAAQAPASTDTTAPPPSDTGSTTTAPGTSTPAASVPAEPTTAAPVNPLPCGAAGDRASTTPDDQ